MAIVKDWREDKLNTALSVAWMITVVSAFFGSVFTLFELPALGAVYPFRLVLPITAVLYLIWAIREKHNPWKHATKAQRACYILGTVLVAYGAVSLLRAIDVVFTLQRLMNLCLDLCFFFLALELCRNRRILRKTVYCIVGTLIIQIPLGIYEVFFGGVFDPLYDTDRHLFRFFGGKYQRPVVASGNTNDFSMMLVFMLAILLLYWAWQHREEKTDWIPIGFIAPTYFLICAGDARLCWLAFWLLMVGFVAVVLTIRPIKRWVVVLTVLLMVVTLFGMNYHELALKKPASKAPAKTPTASTSTAAPSGNDRKETSSSSPNRTLKEEMFTVDDQTGEVSFNLNYSAGARMDLLFHAGNCLLHSDGFGVGLGNTEQLAKENAASRMGGVWNIHCFLARMAADFGVFFLIPALILAFLLLREVIGGLWESLRAKKWTKAALWLLYLVAMVSYPIASTAPSDAQDCLTMWLFLAVVVLLPTHFHQTQQ